MSYLTILRALRKEEDSTNKLNKCNYFYTTISSATNNTNSNNNVLAGDGPTGPLNEVGLAATKETKFTKKVPPANTPVAPLQPAWLIVYRDEVWRLRGGSDEREAGTVRECSWDPYAGWTVILTNGGRVPLRAVRAVSKINTRGQILAAWTVREHGYDGDGPLAAEEPRRQEPETEYE